jgi:hypothetical protein
MSYHMIIRRGSTWHFRRAVPKVLRSIVGQREIVKSLHTSNLREAKSRAITVAAEVDALLWRARRTLANPHAAIAAVAANIVREDADWRRGRLDDAPTFKLVPAEDREALREADKAARRLLEQWWRRHIGEEIGDESLLDAMLLGVWTCARLASRHDRRSRGLYPMRSRGLAAQALALRRSTLASLTSRGRTERRLRAEARA